MTTGRHKLEIITLASDHNGVALKKYLYDYLKNIGHKCVDLGPFFSDKSVDYTDYAKQLGNIVHSGDSDRGILICGTGVGMSIVVNRYENVRGALIHNLETASKCREHNNSNVLCLGSWLTPARRAQEIVDSWLGTSFGEGRHVRRIEKITPKDVSHVVFTNGVFDILHTGHIEMLKFAKSLGGNLVVGINSDRAVRILKGPTRPINNQNDRKRMLESLDCVDEVIIFDDIEAKKLVDIIHPNILVKGGEWTADEVRERDGVSSHIDIKIYPIVSDYSTTNVLKKIKSIDSWEKNEPS
mgnify:CR=1 FL=1